MTPTFHFLIRAAIASAGGYATHQLWSSSLPLGIVVNVGLGAFFLLFWIWPFPWGDVMLLENLEEKRKALLPHDSSWRFVSCTQEACALAGSKNEKCIRIIYMMAQTRKRKEQLDQAVFRSGAPYFATMIAVVLIARLGGDTNLDPAAFGLWQTVQVLLGLLSITWWFAMTFGEVTLQRSLNLDLIV
jgi:hypothetical protein